MMTVTLKRIAPFLLALAVFTPGIVSAHQPRIVDHRETTVIDPEISKAYYGQLTGVPDVYTIQAGAPFNLYVSVLVPDISGQTKEVSAIITKDGQPFVALDGLSFSWKKMFEPFGYDTYWEGPEYKGKADAGTYVITVTTPNNDSKYSLAIGEIETFDAKEILNALTLIPQLKRQFFKESPIGFIFSPFGWGTILALYILAGIVGLLYRFALRKFATNTVRGVRMNIGTTDRLIRLLIGIALLLWAITTNWSLMLIFASGFTIFEAVFSWCGLYAALGRNTCPLK